MIRMITGKQACDLVEGDVITASNGENRTVYITFSAREGFFVTYQGGGSDRFHPYDLIDFPFPQPSRN